MHFFSPNIYKLFTQTHYTHVCLCLSKLSDRCEKQRIGKRTRTLRKMCLNISKVLPFFRFAYNKNVFAWLRYEPSSKKKIYHKIAYTTDGRGNRMNVVTGSGSRIDRLKMRESTSALGILAKILRPFKLQLNVFFLTQKENEHHSAIGKHSLSEMSEGVILARQTGMCERMRNVQSSPRCCQSCMNDEAVLQ